MSSSAWQVDGALPSGGSAPCFLGNGGGWRGGGGRPGGASACDRHASQCARRARRTGAAPCQAGSRSQGVVLRLASRRVACPAGGPGGMLSLPKQACRWCRRWRHGPVVHLGAHRHEQRRASRRGARCHAAGQHECHQLLGRADADWGHCEQSAGLPRAEAAGDSRLAGAPLQPRGAWRLAAAAQQTHLSPACANPTDRLDPTDRAAEVLDRLEARAQVRGGRGKKSIGPFLEQCVSSLRRGHANLLCIVPILTDAPKGNK